MMIVRGRGKDRRKVGGNTHTSRNEPPEFISGHTYRAHASSCQMYAVVYVDSAKRTRGNGWPRGVRRKRAILSTAWRIHDGNHTANKTGRAGLSEKTHYSFQVTITLTEGKEV